MDVLRTGCFQEVQIESNLLGHARWGNHHEVSDARVVGCWLGEKQFVIDVVEVLEETLKIVSMTGG